MAGDYVDLSAMPVLPTVKEFYSLITQFDPGIFERIPNLQRLQMTQFQTGRINFRRMTNLRELIINEFRSAVSGFGEAPCLMRFVGFGTPEKMIENLAHQPHLQDVSLMGTSTRSLECLRGHPELRLLRMVRVRKLESIDVIASIPKLWMLWSHDSPVFYDVEPLSESKSIEHFDFENSGPIRTVEPLTRVPGVKRLFVRGPKKYRVEQFDERDFIGHPTLHYVWLDGNPDFVYKGPNHLECDDYIGKKFSISTCYMTKEEREFENTRYSG